VRAPLAGAPYCSRIARTANLFERLKKRSEAGISPAPPKSLRSLIQNPAARSPNIVRFGQRRAIRHRRNGCIVRPSEGRTQERVTWLQKVRWRISFYRYYYVTRKKKERELYRYLIAKERERRAGPLRRIFWREEDSPKERERQLKVMARFFGHRTPSELKIQEATRLSPRDLREVLATRLGTVSARALFAGAGTATLPRDP
jgi:hypothetical protein